MVPERKCAGSAPNAEQCQTQVVGQDCKNVTKEVPREVCLEAPQEICENVPVEVCQPVRREKCECRDNQHNKYSYSGEFELSSWQRSCIWGGIYKTASLRSNLTYALNYVIRCKDQ